MVSLSREAPLLIIQSTVWILSNCPSSLGVLGGGVCLGSMTLLEEDRFSDHVMALARYFLAQGVSNSQRCLLVGAVSRDSYRQLTSPWFQILFPPGWLDPLTSGLFDLTFFLTTIGRSRSSG